MKRLIFGCGYLGARVAARWRDSGDDVSVVTRSPERARRLSEDGLGPIVADVTRPESLRDLPEADTVLYAVGHDRSAGTSMREVYVDGLRHVLHSLEVLEGRPSRFVYISSTGVYGQSDGQWVDENSPCEPTRDSGRICLEAEAVLADDPLSGRAVVLRLAGLYGPTRLPSRQALLSGEPLSAPRYGYLNLIHVEDAATVVLAAAEHPRPSPLYLVSDGRPALREAYYAAAAELLGAPPPTFIDPDPASPKAARAAANRRICNARMLAELPVQLQYPTFKEGLAAGE